MKKKLLAIVAVVVCLCVATGGTIAFLTDKTASKENVFTVGKVDIELAETTSDYKMIPGKDISKDPKVTVKANSEASWVFVKAVESGGDVTVNNKTYSFADFIEWEAADGWTKLSSADGTDGTYVYYKQVDAVASDTVYSFLKNDKVKTNEKVTSEMMDEITANTTKQPKLTFTAYAIQKEGFSSASAAWAEASK